MKRDGPLILLVGHCLPDSMALARAVARSAPGARVKRVNSERALQRRLPDAALALVNRALDGRFLDADGVALIARLTARGAGPALMLVSDYAEAQERAVAAGAAPGFGKRELGDARTANRLRAALVGRGQPASPGGETGGISSGRSP